MKHIDLDIEVLTVREVAFRKEDSGWCILRTDRGTAKGVVPFEIAPGVALTLHGRWGKSKFNGEDEFSFVHAQINLPDNSVDLLHYAAAMTKGLGPSKERAIWAAYGDEWQQHEDLDGVPGITPAIRDAWRETLRNMELHRERTEAIAFLLAHECSIKMAEAAWAEHGHGTVAKIQGDPYLLSYLPRYGFNDVDGDIRLSFGVEDSDPRRMDAAIMYCLVTRCLSNGSTVADYVHLAAEVDQLVPSKPPAFGEGVQRLVDTGRIKKIDETLLAAAKDAAAEQAIWDFVIANAA